MMSTMAKEAPSLLSLPDDILLIVLARVPRFYYPILSCVSKKLLCLVRSFELYKTRSLMGKDCFYVCFKEDLGLSLNPRHWFTLTDQNRRLVSTPFTYPPQPYSTALMVGHEIYFIGHSYDYLSRSMWILDSRSGKLRKGPSSLVANFSPAVGLIDEKIYIFGGGYELNIKAQVFDLKTQTWRIAPNPSIKRQYTWRSLVSPSLDRKIYARIAYGCVAIVYDPRDGNCEIIELPTNQRSSSKDVCVIDNLLYFYDHSNLELLWYESKDKEWRLVYGLKLNGCDLKNLTITECNGKMAFLWRKPEKKEIWCAMIALHRRGVVNVQARVEWSNCVLFDVPPHYNIIHCFGGTD